MKRLWILTSLLPLIAGACGADGKTLPRGADGGVVCDRCGACEVAVPVTSANHVDGPIVYADPPPTSGDHNPCWAVWGVHADAVPAERWVHNLEHGGVVFLYNCPASGCGSDADALARITAFVSAHPLALMTPYAGMPQRFAVVSWGRRLVSSCVDSDAAIRFYDSHVNWGPESISSDPDPSCG